MTSGVQSLADELLRFELLSGYDVTATYDRARDIEREAAGRDDLELVMRARLVQADALERLGDAAAGARLASVVASWAERRGHRFLLSRAHRHLSSVYYNLGDTAACLDHALKSVELLDATTPAPFRARHLGALADALGWSGHFAEARERYRAALEIHTAEHDVHAILTTLNNLAYTECDAGEPRRAWQVAQRMRAVAAEEGWPLGADDLDTIARIQIGLGDYAAAEQTMRDALAGLHAQPYQEAHGTAEVLLTLAEIQRLRGDLAGAQRTLDTCRELCEERQLGELRVRVLQEQASLYGAAGRFEEAYQTHRSFYAAEQERRDAERVARVRTRVAIFETTEARQEAQRFQEMALRDPLTGLHNRRYLDERLPAVLAEAAARGTPVTVALVDVDHFKQINDSRSHDHGDRVLVHLATLLTTAAAASPDCFAARLGGEEFVLVLPGLPYPEAIRRLEEFRAAVEGYRWRPITVDLPVTVSIGVARAGVGSTRSTLLAEADEYLYRAKRSGRNQIAPAV